ASAVEYKSLERERALESAAYVASNFDLTKRLAVDLGLRFSMFSALGKGTQYEYESGMPKSEGSVTNVIEYDKNETIKTYGSPEFRLAARYLIDPSLSIKAGYNN